MTTSIALFDCPHCIDEFSFDYQKIAKLNYGWRVRVRCPGCGNIVHVVMLAYTLIHNCDPDNYQPGEIVEVLARLTRILRRSGGWRLTNSEWRFSKRRLDGDLSRVVEEVARPKGGDWAWGLSSLMQKGLRSSSILLSSRLYG